MFSNTQSAQVYIPWWAILVQGILAVVIGILLLLDPAATIFVYLQFLGVYWFTMGIFNLITIFNNRAGRGKKLGSGILGILAGLLVILHPLWSTLLLPAIMAALLGFIGFLMGVISLIAVYQGQGWGMITMGVLSFLFSALLFASPIASGVILTGIFGLISVIGGISTVLAAIKERSNQAANKTTPEPIR